MSETAKLSGTVFSANATTRTTPKYLSRQWLSCMLITKSLSFNVCLVFESEHVLGAANMTPTTMNASAPVFICIRSILKRRVCVFLVALLLLLALLSIRPPRAWWHRTAVRKVTPLRTGHVRTHLLSLHTTQSLMTLQYFVCLWEAFRNEQETPFRHRPRDLVPLSMYTSSCRQLYRPFDRVLVVFLATQFHILCAWITTPAHFMMWLTMTAALIKRV